MDLDPLKDDTGQQREKGATNTRNPKMNSWFALHQIVKMLISSGYGGALLAIFLILGLAWIIFGGMESAEKGAAFIAFIRLPIVNVAGWVVAFAAIVVAKRLQKFQKDYYEREIIRLREQLELAYSEETGSLFDKKTRPAKKLTNSPK